MRWVSENTDADAVFLVVEGRDFFAARDAEWFPALTGRISAAAVQGYEWLGNVDFAQRIAAFRSLQGCRIAGSACVEDWSSRHETPFSYLYVLKRPQAQETTTSCCRALLDQLNEAPAYEVVYQNIDVAIYMRHP